MPVVPCSGQRGAAGPHPGRSAPCADFAALLGPRSAAGLAACAARTPLRHAAASQTRSALSRADLGPPLLAAPEVGPAAPRWPLHDCRRRLVSPSPPGGEGKGGVPPGLPPGGRPGGCRCLCRSVGRPAAPKPDRHNQSASAARVPSRVHVRSAQRIAYTLDACQKKAGTRRCPLKVRLCGPKGPAS